MLKYQNDDEALEMIYRAEADIKYLCKCQKVNNYKGQTPEQYINCLEVSDIAVEIAILLMCSEDGSVERVKEAVKGIIYGKTKNANK